jgi:MoaA/NifB/PqqE/SkfB family radical SAM enzyme
MTRREGKLPRIILTVTIYPGNYQDVFKLIDEATRIKMDSVALMRMNDRFDESLKRYSFEEEAKVCREYEAYAKKAGIRIGTPRMISSGIRRLLYRGGTKCPVTYDGVYVTAEGLITPCCALPKYVVGNVLNCDIESIWNSEKFRKFRDVQRTVCAHCDLLDITYKSR